MIESEKQAGSLWLNKVNAKNDTFTRIHEDPMLVIRQKEKEVCCYSGGLVMLHIRIDIVYMSFYTYAYSCPILTIMYAYSFILCTYTHVYTVPRQCDQQPSQNGSHLPRTRTTTRPDHDQVNQNPSYLLEIFRRRKEKFATKIA